MDPSWVITFLVGDHNLNLHLPQASWEGGQPKVNITNRYTLHSSNFHPPLPPPGTSSASGASVNLETRQSSKTSSKTLTLVGRYFPTFGGDKIIVVLGLYILLLVYGIKGKGCYYL